jgi:DNA segregation ATPase FtsK/SpoIIIE, S-DNA-T family
VAADTSGGWSRIRTPHTSLREAVAACTTYADLTPDVPSLADFRPRLAALPSDTVPAKPVPVTA